MEAARLVEAMAKVSDSLRYPIDVDESLQMITASTVDAIPAIDHASISVTAKNGRIQTLAPTDQIAVRADELQYEVGQGPCLRAALDEPIVQVDDLAGDVRWLSSVRRRRSRCSWGRRSRSSSAPIRTYAGR